MITPAFSPTATERVLPRLALDFTTASLDPRVTFTRTGNTATVTNSSGNIVGINANLPRFDYDPITLTCKGLLIEEARTNALTYSEQFDNPAWGKSEVTVTANSVVSPSGTLSADTLQNNTNTGSHGIFTSIVFATGSTMTVYAKAGTTNFVGITNTSNFAAYSGATFNLSTGAVGVSAACTASMTPVGNGWYRCVVANTTTYAGSFFVVSVLESNQAPWLGYAGTNKNIYIWGAQLEIGPFGTSYIPTVASTVTRNADVATMTGTNFSSWYNASEGTFQSSVRMTGYSTSYNDYATFFSVNDGSASNQQYININGGPVNVAFIGTGGSAIGQTVANITTNPVTGVGSYKVNNFAFAANATSTATDTSGTVPTVDRLYFGNDGTNIRLTRMNGCLVKFNYWPQRLTNAEVQAFSKQG